MTRRMQGLRRIPAQLAKHFGPDFARRPQIDGV